MLHAAQGPVAPAADMPQQLPANTVLAALQTDQEGELVLDSGELDSMDVTPKKKGSAKPKAPSQQGSKPARAEDANASSSMQVR